MSNEEIIAVAEGGVRARVHLFLPLLVRSVRKFRAGLCRSGEWKPATLDAKFYMRYIERIFCCGNDKSCAMTASCTVMQRTGLDMMLRIYDNSFRLAEARVYSFDTSIAMLDLIAEVECEKIDTVADICSIFRQTDSCIVRLPADSAQNTSGRLRQPGEKVTVNSIAKEVLRPLGECSLFDHLSRDRATRADVFTAIVAEDTAENVNINMYRIADGLNARYNEKFPEEAIYMPFPHLRWAITARGACSVGLMTADPYNRAFIRDKWIGIAENRHALWYVLVLHQKYAMYHYLNEIAEGGDRAVLRDFQRKIVSFNTGYRFEIISEDDTYQKPYQMARDAKHVESVFSDIDEEIERINDYHNASADKNNVIAMTIVSLVCAISTFVDIYELSAKGNTLGEILSALSAVQLVLLGAVAVSILAAVAFLLVKPLVKRAMPAVKRWLLRVYSRLFLK